MKLTPIRSNRCIKRLLLDEAKAIKNGEKTRLIILSQKRFSEFIGREDVRESSYDDETMCIGSDDKVYTIYENKNVTKCREYGIVTFQYIGGCYIVKQLCRCDDKYWRTYDEPDEIVYIE